ncbi:MAG TPA: MBL fold metallo-hydrolase [Candidatus Cloacimonadota bacterium]|nr:MBL fold metallo-hydrolase [Candidatus Cloacimonadota bacterium]
MQFIKMNVNPQFDTNTYILWDEVTSEGMIIDPSHEDQKLLDAVKNIKLKYIVNTHSHGDHIGGNALLKEKTGALLAIHEQDAPLLTDPQKNLSAFMEEECVSPAADLLLKDGDCLTLGTNKIRVIHTPGHSRGCICLLVNGLLFSGDTLFDANIGRTDLPGGSYEEIICSIKEKLFVLPDDIKVFPGHGEYTTIGDEKVGNPFVGFAARSGF